MSALSILVCSHKFLKFVVFVRGFILINSISVCSHCFKNSFGEEAKERYINDSSRRNIKKVFRDSIDKAELSHEWEVCILF
jgi:hypothetical protein